MSFDYPHPMQIVKGRLEAEGIPCHVKDELTVQMHHFISTGIGGIKLQVNRKDYNRAVRILQKAGYNIESYHNPLLEKLEYFTSKLPFLKSRPFTTRLTIIIASIILIPTFITVYLVATGSHGPDDVYLRSRLMEVYWCVDYIEYQGTPYATKTVYDSTDTSDVPCNACFLNGM